jgi:hypothetical protein
MKAKAVLLLLIFLTLQISSIKALSLNDRIEAAANWISTKKASEFKGFLNINENKLYVEENALTLLALTLYRKTLTSNRYDEEIEAALSFILSSQETLKKDYRHYYDLNTGNWGSSGKLFYWNAYVIEVLSYSSFQLRFYGNLNESEIAYCSQAIASVKSFLNAWKNYQKSDGSWFFEYENKTGAKLSENSALLTSLLYLALYEHFWGSNLEALKYAESAEKTLDWILSLQEINPESWGYGGFYQNKEKNLQDAYSNAKAAFALNSYLRVTPSLKEDFKLKYYKVRDALTLWVEEFVEKMLDEYYGVYHSRGLLGIIKYPKGVPQTSLMVTALVETWIDMGDLKYRDLAEKMLNWIIGENEIKKDFQNVQGGFYEGIKKNQMLINQLSLTTTALTLTALINCVLIGIPEISHIQPVLTLVLTATLLIAAAINKKFKN